ncbi:unnamed protein product [Caenorhabditis auriculariae]|uniref:26S proteasome non-ATPase regulatory subunit 5 n=1 Tax=Caenorhabditis auriculariae TaxID=2777116 RepID=A0A8S1GTV4_9PELO|nr:unnamed protein product [Caenorhabditis auriculariae]
MESESLVGSEAFLELRKKFAASKNQETALEILEQLVSIEHDSVNEDAWLDCKDLLRILFDALPAAFLLEKNQLLFLQVLPKAPANVVSALADLISVKQDAGRILTHSSSAVAIAFARRINHSETYEAVSRLLAPTVSNQLVVDELLDQLKTADSEHKFKIYEVLSESFRVGTFHPNLEPILASIVKELDKSNRDVLTQITAVELLGHAALTSQNSARILEEHGIPDKIYALMMFAKEAPDATYVYPAMDKFPDFPGHIIDSVKHFDLLDASSRELAFESFANLAYTEERKEHLVKTLGAETIKTVLEAYGAAINSGPLELRQKNIEAATVLFENGSDVLCASWFSAIGDPFPHLMISAVKKPFSEFRMAILKFLITLFQYPTIILMFIRLEGFTDWLLNLSTETEFQLACTKKDVVRAILKAAEKDSNLLEGHLVQKLESYLSPPSSSVPTVELAL